MAALMLSIGAIVVGVDVTFGSMTFPGTSNSLLRGVSLDTPAMSLFMGPQPQDNIDPVTRPLAVDSGDMCNPGPVDDATLVDGKVVLLANSASLTCSSETVYLKYLSLGAAAIIFQNTLGTPGLHAYMQDGTHGARTRSHAMMYLDFSPASQAVFDAIQGSAGANVTVYPDPNAWIDAYNSWYYQVFVRFIPSITLIASGLTAAYFFVIHMQIMFDDASSVGNVARYLRARQRLCRALRQIATPHVVLVLEVLTATSVGIMNAVGGFFSNSVLPDRLSMFMMTQFTGWSFVCSILSARVWYSHLQEVNGRATDAFIVTRVLRGDFVWVTGFVCASSIIGDVFGCVYYATYHLTSTLAAPVGVIALILQIAVGTNLVVATLRFFRTARATTTKVAAVVDDNSRAAMQRILSRLAACTLGMALSMLLYCVGLMIISGPQSFFITPSGWTLAWSLGMTGRALDSAFRVAMFKPRQRNARHIITV